MRLVYEDTLQEVKVGDEVTLDGEVYTVDYFRKPHKPASSGHVTVKDKDGDCAEYYVTVIGAKWIEREDQG